jgi:hypothetical protein
MDIEMMRRAVQVDQGLCSECPTRAKVQRAQIEIFGWTGAGPQNEGKEAETTLVTIGWKTHGT